MSSNTNRNMSSSATGWAIDWSDVLLPASFGWCKEFIQCMQKMSAIFHQVGVYFLAGFNSKIWRFKIDWWKPSNWWIDRIERKYFSCSYKISYHEKVDDLWQRVFWQWACILIKMRLWSDVNYAHVPIMQIFSQRCMHMIERVENLLYVYWISTLDLHRYTWPGSTLSWIDDWPW